MASLVDASGATDLERFNGFLDDCGLTRDLSILLHLLPFMAIASDEGDVVGHATLTRQSRVILGTKKFI